MDTTLTYIGNGSDKFYRIYTVTRPDGQIEVRTEYGPNSRRNRPNTGVHFTGDPVTASQKAYELENTKRRKGYQVESADDLDAQKAPLAELPKPPTKATLAKTARAAKSIAALQPTCNAVLL